MPKKFDTNTKSAEARTRKETVKQAKENDRQQRLEDEYWREDDKQILKKQQRKEDRDKKDHDKVQRKLENQKLLDEEAASLAASKAKKNPDLAPKKITQAQIQQHQEATATTAQSSVLETKKKNLNTEEMVLEENVNRMKLEGESARNVDEAIKIFHPTTLADVDSHPEKRMKSAYQTFEDETLPRLKQENPTLRLSQLKQLLKKEWMKSPDNPFNKPTKAFNQSNKIDEDENDSDQD